MKKETYNCFVCGASDYTVINTYKHHWYYCNECASVVAERKKRYLFSSFIFDVPVQLLHRLSGQRLGVLIKDFLRCEPRIEDESLAYSQYATMLSAMKGLEAWDEGVKLDLARLDQCGVEYKNKRILCISGGPGIFAKHLVELGNEVVITEFNASTVQAMKDHLGLDAVQYDVNNDKLSDVVSGKFDIVFMTSVINFCIDQPKFIEELKNVLNDNAAVMISNDTVALGYMLTWQFEEYIPTRFAHNEAFLQWFYRVGHFKLLGRFQYKYNSYFYRFSTGGWKNKIAYILRTPFWLLYGAIALLPWKNLNRMMWSKNDIFVLQCISEE